MVGDRRRRRPRRAACWPRRGRSLPAYVQPVIPGVSASPSAGGSQRRRGRLQPRRDHARLGHRRLVGRRPRRRGGRAARSAAAEDHSFVLHYDGAAWRETSVPDVGPLTAVARGRRRRGLGARPAGRHPALGRPAVAHGLTAARRTAAPSCAAWRRSRPDDVWAVGSEQGAPFATHWDGATWRPAALPATAGRRQPERHLGHGDRPVGGGRRAPTRAHVLTLHYDGTSWSPVPDAGVSDGGLLTVATVAPNDVWAGGDALLAALRRHAVARRLADVQRRARGARRGLADERLARRRRRRSPTYDGAAWPSVTAAGTWTSAR